MTGSFVTARAYWVWGFVSGARAGEAAGCGMGDAGCVGPAERAAYASRISHPASRSQHPIHDRAEKHDHTHDPIGGKKRRVEA